MNYIKHLTVFYEQIASDERFTPVHISLYHALFQIWNMNHFENPVSVNRAQVLTLCKIGSNHTYYKALRDLRDWKFIEYAPSSSPKRGAMISLCKFDAESIFNHQKPEKNLNKIDTTISAKLHHYRCNFDIGQNEKKQFNWCKNDIGIGAKMHHHRCKIDIGSGAKMHPSLNNININYKLYREENFLAENFQAQKSNNKISNSKKMKTDTTLPFEPEEEKRKKVAPKKEKDFVRPTQNEVRDFFKTQNYPELEAQKFFNHFESNGWKVGGKSPMIDWHAAARNWILNSPKYTTPPGPPNLTTPKNYGEPL